MSEKRALITGIGGQDGTYLSKFLLDKDYEVHGVVRRSSNHSNRNNLKHYLSEEEYVKLNIHEGDLADSIRMYGLVAEISPAEIYNLGAQSHVGTSFRGPQETLRVNTNGPLNLMEAIHAHGLSDRCRLYQASTSEMFGGTVGPQNEASTFMPSSPYAVSKQAAHSLVRIYRSGFDMFTCAGILFNHESPYRGHNFVTRKITMGLANIGVGKQELLELGNLDASRDWGHARDYVEAMWSMLQLDSPRDLVIGTDQSRTVRQFVQATLDRLSLEVEWRGHGVDEEVVCISVGNKQLTPHIQPGQTIIRVSRDFYRPLDDLNLCSDSSKAQKDIGWKTKTTFEQLVQEMVDSDLKLATQAS